MWEIGECMMLIYLAIGSAIDIVKRRISVWYFIIGTGSVLLYQEKTGEETGILIFGGVFIGVLFLCLSKVTNQGIGYGDSWMILILGVYLGFWKVLVALSIAFLSASIIAGIGCASQVFRRHTRIPFLPFLLIGYLGVCGW